MKRAGFTMIELIFVIVILGILSAVALPKFIGVSDQAQEGKLKAYIGTLNRTIAPALWSASISSDSNGSVSTKDYSKSLITQLNTPDFGDANKELDNPDLTKCSTYAAPATPTKGYEDTEIVSWGSVSEAEIGTKTYNVRCMDGSMSSSPAFALSVKVDEGKETVLVK